MDELEFLVELQNFNADEKQTKGRFTGLLVNMQSKEAAKGYYKFMPGSLKNNNNKKLFLMYNHYGNIIPVGTLVGVETEKGFEVEGQFHLDKDENGNYINQEAVKLYSLMKDMGINFEMSVGGQVTKYKEVIEDGKPYLEIVEFNAIEGSLTPKGAIKGSRVNKVFNNKLGGKKMDKKELEILLSSILASFKEDMLKAGADAEIKALPEKFADLTAKFDEVKNELEENFKTEFNNKLNEINEVIKTLRADFKATEKEVSLAEQFAQMLQIAEKAGVGVSQEFSTSTELKFAANAANTTTTAKGIKTTYVTKILENIVASNPVLKDVSFMSISDGSVTIPKELAGLPECGWIGETAEREETEVSKIDNVTISIHQLYALPAITNKLLATNFIGYAAFLMKRTEYALALKLADALFAGTGTNMPLGILKDSKVTNKKEIDTTDDATFVDSIIDIYYSLPTQVAINSKWYMTRATWARIAKLKNSQKDFYITDLNNGNTRTLMTRPVELIDSDGADIKDIGVATAQTDVIAVLGDIKNGVLGIQNDAMTMRLEDRITSKGVTKYYIEKGVGLGVQMPEYFVKIVKSN